MPIPTFNGPEGKIYNHLIKILKAIQNTTNKIFVTLLQSTYHIFPAPKTESKYNRPFRINKFYKLLGAATPWCIYLANTILIHIPVFIYLH